MMNIERWQKKPMKEKKTKKNHSLDVGLHNSLVSFPTRPPKRELAAVNVSRWIVGDYKAGRLQTTIAATLLTLRSTRRTTVVAPPTYEVADSLACTVSELTMSNVAEVLEMNVVDVKGSCSFVDRT